MSAATSSRSSRDLVEEAIRLERERRRARSRTRPRRRREARLLDALVGKDASEATRDAFRSASATAISTTRRSRSRSQDGAGMPSSSCPACRGPIGMINLGDMMGKAFGGAKPKRRKLTSRAAWASWSTRRATSGSTRTISTARRSDAEKNGIVFLDEIDKIARRDGRGGADVSREGVQRDLLPLIEGTTVATKYGPVKTDHVLFIASGAFHVAKPSDLLPELQGRLPIRVELKALTEDDFVRILTDTRGEPDSAVCALLGTEGVTLDFTDDGIAALARIAAQVNDSVENIGARRLQTVMEKLLEEVSFTASDRAGETISIDAAFVEKNIGDLARNADLSRFIL